MKFAVLPTFAPNPSPKIKDTKSDLQKPPDKKKRSVESNIIEKSQAHETRNLEMYIFLTL